MAHYREYLQQRLQISTHCMSHRANSHVSKSFEHQDWF